MSDEDWGDDGEDGGWGSDDLLDEDEDYIPTVSSKAESTPKDTSVDMLGGVSLLEVMEAAEKNKDSGVKEDKFIHQQDMFKTFMEEQRTKQYAGLFKIVYVTSQKFQKKWAIPMSEEEQLKEIVAILKEISSDVPEVKPSAKRSAEKKECEVCYSEFSSDSKNMVFEKCSHSGICQTCFRQYLRVRIRDKDVMPWIPCPTENCDVYLTAEEIHKSGIDISEMYLLAEVYLAKHLMRQQDWVACANDECEFGFIVGKNSQKEERHCLVCNLKQEVAPKSIEVDPEFQKMLEEGKVRKCPACTHPAIKEFGLCNVLQCSNCAIWWNWRTRETGQNSRALKAKAKSTGTLWEAGELSYQQKLQRENLPAFIALLERNGIKYDPNYQRGGW